jgi:hypothetical protein
MGLEKAIQWNISISKDLVLRFGTYSSSVPFPQGLNLVKNKRSV